MPRLLGRTQITFAIKWSSKPGMYKLVGNITIIADRFAAPITTGNFIDLCSRGFYTGLPIKFIQKIGIGKLITL